ncbi:MAG: PRC-barrel domain-containing protein [Rhizobiaceae bacterium]
MMLRTLLASTAIAALMATSAMAQTTETAPADPMAPAVTTTDPAAAPEAPVAASNVASADGNLASNLIGETVYNGTGDDADNIGAVNDLVIASDGAVQSVIVGVGGFLGIGQKNVALDYKAISWAERDGDRWIVVNATQEQLESLPDFDATPYEPAPAVAATETAPATDTTAVAPADPMTAPADTTAEAPAEPAMDATTTAAIDKNSLAAVPAEQLSAETLIGTTVYGADDANVGEIGDVVLSTDGKIDAVILDVGGFLGIGEKQVAVGMDNLAFLTDTNNNRYLYTSFTKDQLDAAPAYDKSTWAEKRGEQRILVQ